MCKSGLGGACDGPKHCASDLVCVDKECSYLDLGNIGLASGAD